MQLDWQGWSQFILALVAVVGGYGAHRLNKRGQVTQAAQQTAANDLATRAQGFDEMEALVDRLNHEIARLEAKADREAQAQARRCRTTLDHFVMAFTTLQGQVVSEAARQAAEKAHIEVEVHMAEDHPDVLPPGTAPA